MFDWAEFNEQMLQLNLHQQMEEQNRLLREQTNLMRRQAEVREEQAESAATVPAENSELHNLLANASKEGASSEAMFRLGIYFLQNHNGAEADVWLRKASDNGNAAAMNALAYYLKQTGNVQEALFWWRKSADLGNASASNSYIFQFLIPEKRWADIEKYSVAAYQADVYRESTNALSNSAIALYLQGQIDDAIARFKLALEREDKASEAEASWWLARIYTERGDNEQAAIFRNRSAISGGYTDPGFK